MYNPRITSTWILENCFGGGGGGGGGGGRYLGCINRVYKVGFYLGLKNARKMKNCILLSEHTVFLSAGTLYYYYFLFCDHAP